MKVRLVTPASNRRRVALGLATALLTAAGGLMVPRLLPANTASRRVSSLVDGAETARELKGQRDIPDYYVWCVAPTIVLSITTTTEGNLQYHTWTAKVNIAGSTWGTSDPSEVLIRHRFKTSAGAALAYSTSITDYSDGVGSGTKTAESDQYGIGSIFHIPQDTTSFRVESTATGLDGASGTSNSAAQTVVAWSPVIKYYVSSGGDDATGTGLIGAPVQTLKRAIAKAKNDRNGGGDQIEIVMISGETTINDALLSLNNERNWYIHKSGAGYHIFNETQALGDGSGGSQPVSIVCNGSSKSENIRIDGIKFTSTAVGAGNNKSPDYFSSVDTTKNIALTNCYFERSSNTIGKSFVIGTYDVAAGFTALNCIFDTCYQIAVYHAGHSGVNILGCQFLSQQASHCIRIGSIWDGTTVQGSGGQVAYNDINGNFHPLNADDRTSCRCYMSAVTMHHNLCRYGAFSAMDYIEDQNGDNHFTHGASYRQALWNNVYNGRDMAIVVEMSAQRSLIYGNVIHIGNRYSGSSTFTATTHGDADYNDNHPAIQFNQRAAGAENTSTSIINNTILGESTWGYANTGSWFIGYNATEPTFNGLLVQNNLFALHTLSGVLAGQMWLKLPSGSAAPSCKGNVYPDVSGNRFQSNGSTFTQAQWVGKADSTATNEIVSTETAATLIANSFRPANTATKTNGTAAQVQWNIDYYGNAIGNYAGAAGAVPGAGGGGGHGDGGTFPSRRSRKRDRN